MGDSTNKCFKECCICRMILINLLLVKQAITLVGFSAASVIFFWYGKRAFYIISNSQKVAKLYQ